MITIKAQVIVKLQSRSPPLRTNWVGITHILFFVRRGGLLRGKKQKLSFAGNHFIKKVS